MSETIQTPDVKATIDVIEKVPIYSTVQVSTFKGKYLEHEFGIDELKALANDHARLLAENAEYKAEVERLRTTLNYAKVELALVHGHDSYICTHVEKLEKDGHEFANAALKEKA